MTFRQHPVRRRGIQQLLRGDRIGCVLPAYDSPRASQHGRLPVLLCPALVFCCLTVSSGQESIPIRGGERLVWTQVAGSIQALREHTYILYVDGSPGTLIDARCLERPFAGVYTCWGGLPAMTQGRHVLELTSVVNGAESPRSAPIVVTLSNSQLTSLQLTQSATDPSSLSTTVCGTQGSQECYGVRTIATDLDRVEMLDITPDRRLLLFTEGGTQLRVIADGALVPEPALKLGDPRSRVVGLAIDAQFSESRTVFVAWTGPTRDGGLVLNVTRYRMVENSLGEGATIVSGLPFADDARAPLAVDGEGLLYVALPDVAVTTRVGTQQAPFGGAVLRFDRDGLTRGAHGRQSPIVSYGYAQPSALAIDRTSGRLWLAGKSDATQFLSSLDLSSREDQPWPLRPMLADASGFEGIHLTGAGPSLALAGKEETGRALFIASDRLLPITLNEDRQVVALGEVPLNRGTPLAVASAAMNSWYVAALTEQGRSTILLLERRR